MWPKWLHVLSLAFASTMLTLFYLEHTHTQPFNGPFSGTTRVGRYQKGKTNLDLTEARDSEWQWHQLGHMQVCTMLQTDSHASTPPLVFYRLDALPAAQPTASKHWRLTLFYLELLGKSSPNSKKHRTLPVSLPILVNPAVHVLSSSSSTGSPLNTALTSK